MIIFFHFSYFLKFLFEFKTNFFFKNEKIKRNSLSLKMFYFLKKYDFFFKNLFLKSIKSSKRFIFNFFNRFCYIFSYFNDVHLNLK